MSYQLAFKIKFKEQENHVGSHICEKEMIFKQHEHVYNPSKYLLQSQKHNQQRTDVKKK